MTTSNQITDVAIFYRFYIISNRSDFLISKEHRDMGGVKAKAQKIVVHCWSLAGTGHFYAVSKHRLTPTIEFLRFDPVVGKHVLYREGKVKKGVKKTKAGGR